MRKIILILIIVALGFGIGYSYRIPNPIRITDFDQKGLVAINDNFNRLWNVTNGRFSLNTVTENPDGSLEGNGGDLVLYNNSGTYYLEICVGGKVWKGTLLSDTP